MRIITLFLICSLLLLSTSCDKKTLRDFKNASAQMKIYGINFTRANIDSFKAGDLSKDDLRILNRATRRYLEAVKIFDAEIKVAEQIIKDSKSAPKTTLDKLRVVFSEQVVAEFNRILDTLAQIPGANNEKVKNIIASIRLTIATIESLLSETESQGELNYV